MGVPLKTSLERNRKLLGFENTVYVHQNLRAGDFYRIAHQERRRVQLYSSHLHH